MEEIIKKVLEDNGYLTYFQEPFGDGERYSSCNKKGDRIFYEVVYKKDTIVEAE